MAHWLCAERRGQATNTRMRFDPVDWTVDFPRPMMAAVTTVGDEGLRVDAVYYHRDELAGLIWDAVDRYDHPLLKRETAHDFRNCRLSFRWRSQGLVPLDAVNGPVLTIEGRDPGGAPRTWYVRLWNYATGTPDDAAVALDFARLSGGYLLPAEADPVWAGDIDRMFVSLPPAGFDAAGGAFAAAQEAWVELSEVRCDGPGAVLEVGDATLPELGPEHGLRIANGYDDCYNLTPERVLRNAHALGYRGVILHYVGMSHFFRLAGGAVSSDGGVLNGPCAAWHRDYAARAKVLGYDLIFSLSYELFAEHCPPAWQQRAYDGSPALTGWVPPSTLLSPANATAMAYLHAVAGAFVAILQAAGLPVRFQIGEPWWWLMPDGRPCLYDDAARSALGGDPMPIANVAGPLNDTQEALLDAAGALLASSTHALRDAVKALAPAAEVLLLAYLPTILHGAAWRANLPVGWAHPAYDVLQLEDYDWAASGNVAASAAGIAAAEARLGYPTERQHYLSGFVLSAANAAVEWPAIAAAARAAQARGVAETFVWALPQVLRDGFTIWDSFDSGEKDAVQAFDDVNFPLALGRQVEVSPQFSTAIVASAGGHEARNADWASARTRYDVGPGVRSEADIRELLGFFRARFGPARGFRLRDPFDSVSGDGDNPSPVDERIGTGDGSRARFALVKHYGAEARRITRPVAGSVSVAIAGVATNDFTIAGGWITLDAPPPTGTAVTAGFRFDVPVRFAEDTLTVNRASFMAGEAPSVPLIEVRED